MGLIGDMIGRSLIGDPVRGTAQVVACSQWVSDNSSSANCGMRLVVQAEGIEPFRREYSCLVKPERWPFPGQTLPVVVDRRHPERMRIEWDEVATSDDRAGARADAMVAALRGDGEPGGPAPGSATPTVVHADSDLGRQLLSMLDTHPMGASPGEEGGHTTSAGGGDRLEALHKLGELRDAGVLTEEEFAAEKARVLQSP